MDHNLRAKLDGRIKSYLMEEIRKECGDDFKLIEDRIENYLVSHNLKDVKFIAKAEINLLKKRMTMPPRHPGL
jgi:hypothetical protein